jgi:hypothetical protein
VSIHYSTSVLTAPVDPLALVARAAEPGHLSDDVIYEDPDGYALAGGLEAQVVSGPGKVRCIRVRPAGTYVVERSRSMNLVALREQA